MKCQRCESERIFNFYGKCADRSHSTLNGVSKDGYAPMVEGLCGGDGVRVLLCLECGQLQGTFPVEDPEGFEPPEISIRNPGCVSCQQDDIDPHACPFAAEIHGDFDTLCGCCDECMQECVWDI